MAKKIEKQTLDITMSLRAHQEKDETMGPLFSALHTFADRTIEEFYPDVPDMPYPVVAMEKDRKTRLGYFTPKDGYTLVFRINLNPFSLKNGAQAAETLAHEIVHLWLHHIGQPTKRNYHGSDFHAKMLEYGIDTAGKKGYHTGYVGDTWADWMAQNADLHLEKYLLPGMEEKPKRKLLKHMCHGCNASFRNRRELNAMCLDCDMEFEVVNWDD